MTPKHRLGCLLVLASCWIWAVGAAAAEYEVPVSGQVTATLVEGTVQMLTMTEPDPQPVTTGILIEPPVRMETTEGARLELLLPDGSVLRFGEFTSFHLVEAEISPNRRRINVDVAFGDCWAKVKAFLGDDDSVFHVSTPTATAGVAGTTYRLNVVYFESSEYLVYAGALKVTNRWQAGPGDTAPGIPARVDGPKEVAGPETISMEEWSQKVGAGYRLHIKPDGTYEEPVPFDQRIDQLSPWVQWNQQRDHLF